MVDNDKERPIMYETIIDIGYNQNMCVIYTKRLLLLFQRKLHFILPFVIICTVITEVFIPPVNMAVGLSRTKTHTENAWQYSSDGGNLFLHHHFCNFSASATVLFYCRSFLSLL